MITATLFTENGTTLEVPLPEYEEQFTRDVLLRLHLLSSNRKEAAGALELLKNYGERLTRVTPTDVRGAAELFAENPSAKNWERLEYFMYCWQQRYHDEGISSNSSREIED